LWKNSIIILAERLSISLTANRLSISASAISLIEPKCLKRANFLASFAGAFIYFATLTEVPIIQGLMGAGMGKGPALALLLAGPALSLPSMLVINSVLGLKKTATFVSLVVMLATVTGYVFGRGC